MRAVEDGTLSVGQMRSGLAYEAHLSAEKDRNDRLQRDVPRGDSIDITCHVTGKEYSITSFKGDVMAPENEAGWTQTDLAVRREDGGRAFKLSKDTSSDVGFTKRKHFYLYSTRVSDSHFPSPSTNVFVPLSSRGSTVSHLESNLTTLHQPLVALDKVVRFGPKVWMN